MDEETYIYVISSWSSLECAIDDFKYFGAMNSPIYTLLVDARNSLDHILTLMKEELSNAEKKSEAWSR